MDIQVLSVLVSFLTLVVFILSGLFAYVLGKVSKTESAISDFRIKVAEDYTTKEEHKETVSKEIGSLRELILRIEQQLTEKQKQVESA